MSWHVSFGQHGRVRARVRLIKDVGWVWYCRVCPAADSGATTLHEACTAAGRHVWYCRRLPATKPLEAGAHAVPPTAPIEPIALTASHAGDRHEGTSAR